MAKLADDEFELELKFVGVEYYGEWSEVYFELDFFVNGKSAINKDILKRDRFFCYFLLEEKYNLITAFKSAISDEKPVIWEAFPDPDMCISIYPNRLFPDLQREFENHYTIIFSPNTPNYANIDAYDLYEGISFIMSPLTKEFIKFVQDFEKEYNKFVK